MRWAERHLAALKHNIDQATLYANPADLAILRADFDPESGYHIFRIAQMPDMSGLVNGFTHSVSDVANPLRVKAGRARKQLDPAHCGFVERFQPYHGVAGRSDNWTGPYVHPLALLQDLTNDDKHRNTQPVFLISGSYHLRKLNLAVRMHQLGDHTFPMTDLSFTGVGNTMEVGAEVMRARVLDSEPEINDAGSAAPYIALPEGRGAVHTMERLHRFVHLILSEFARDFPASNF